MNKPNRVDVSIFPKNSTNAYLFRIKECFEQLEGVTVRTIGVREILGSLADAIHRRRRVVIVNWIENFAVKEGAFDVLGAVKVVAACLLMRLAYGRVAYCLHNYYPHGLKAEHRRYASRLISVIRLLVDVTYCHSPMVREAEYVPHPLYDPKFDVLSAAKLNRFVMFGRIARYKKLEELVSVWPTSVSLLILGPCSDPEYLDYLKSIACENIIFDVRYVPELEAKNEVARSAGLIVTHVGDEAIVSGSIFFAMSLGTTVYSTKNQFVSWAESILGSNVILGFDCVSSLIDGVRNLDINTSQFQEVQRSTVLERFSDRAVSSALRSKVLRNSSEV